MTRDRVPGAGPECGLTRRPIAGPKFGYVLKWARRETGRFRLVSLWWDGEWIYLRRIIRVS